MIRDLIRILGPQHRGPVRAFLFWAIAYGVLQGIAVSFLVPVTRALFEGDYPSALRWLAAMAVAALACSTAHYVQAMKGFGVALTALRTMHLRIGDHLVTLPLGWFGPETVASTSQMASKGTLSVGGAAAHLLTPVITGIASPATIVVAVLFFDWRLGIALLLAVPVIAATSRFAAVMISKGDDLAHEAALVATNRVLEYARYQPVLRAFGRTSGTYTPLDDAIENQQIVGRKGMAYSVFGMVVSGLAIQLCFSVLISLGAYLAVGGNLDAVTLIALLGLIARFVQPISEVGEFAGALRMARNEIRRMSAVLDLAPLPDPEEPADLLEPGRIEFEDVHFGYTDALVLDGVSFDVPARSMTALVGPSGSGKTTVTRLIARFWDIGSGSVKVGGTDVREHTTEQLMDQIAMVFQDVYLFDDTLRANILVGREDASDRHLAEASRLAGVDEIVARLPAGWDTRVGEGGTALSGGERQRISIARALIKGSPIVLLDEATAALDPENEQFVQQSIGHLAQTSTVIVIAHKLSTVTAADQILVLGSDGTIAERGTHDSLLEQGGRYRDFWNSRKNAGGWKLVGNR
ncbi:ABC transporter ATP-binding protein [Rhodococcus sovatensis]|uniref:ABC transporter ATP-binding protein n=1 Tax=Rhodococcus sovatensis TaxID=1805840 RepID=A0ABZ2PMG4_9NOCA